MIYAPGFSTELLHGLSNPVKYQAWKSVHIRQYSFQAPLHRPEVHWAQMRLGNPRFKYFGMQTLVNKL
jgi:hypothetical protein